MRFQVFLIALLSTISVLAQNSYELKGNRPLDEVLAEASEKYQLKFSFDPKKVGSHYLERDIKTYSEADFVSELFRELPFRIQLSNGIYLVIPRKNSNRLKQNIVQGKVVDANGEAVPFALIKAGESGTVTNEYGYFTLASNEDSLDLQISHLGFKPYVDRIKNQSSNLSISLQQSSEELQEVVLLSEYQRERRPQPSVFRIDPKNITNLPSLGTVDIFKGLQLLPGIRATDETSAGLSVRGGTPEQNLVLLDGFNLYHLDHFFGIFSTFNPNTLRSVEVSKGGFGAEYGGRISSVIHAHAKTGNTDKISGGVSLNLISADAFLEGPIGNKTTFNFGYRRSLMDVIPSGLFQDFMSSNRSDALGALDDSFDDAFELDPFFYFYDFSGKVTHRFSENSVLDANFYRSFDSYEGSFEVEDNFQVSASGEPFEESKQSIRARRASKSTGEWNTSDTYSFSFYSMYLDLPSWSIVKLPLANDMTLRTFWGKALLRIILYEREAPPNETAPLLGEPQQQRSDTM